MLQPAVRSWLSRVVGRLLMAMDWRWRRLAAQHELLDRIDRGVRRLVLGRLPREPGGVPLVRAYCAHYRIPQDACIDEAMIRRHWDLERELTLRLLASTWPTRAAVFEDCYSQLYRELGWLNELIDKTVPAGAKVLSYQAWRRWLGPPPLKVYEVGAGKGDLAMYLAGQGYECRAAEITTERGARWTRDHTDNLTWGVTDGVDLAKHEPAGTLDVVISDQVVEHLHPSDLTRHMRGALALLKPGGRYIFRTPHRFSGPCDVSRIFGRPFAAGMHLREYTYTELHRGMASAGFVDIGVPGGASAQSSRMRLFGFECTEQLVKHLTFQEMRGQWMAAAEQMRMIESQIVLSGTCPLTRS